MFPAAFENKQKLIRKHEFPEYKTNSTRQINGMKESPLPDWAETEPFFVARQPIFDGQKKIMGYELLFRDGENSTGATFRDHNVATSQIIADGFALSMEGVDNKAKALINFSEQMILDGTPLALPRERCIIEVLEHVRPTGEVVKACKKLKKAGYHLALDDYDGRESLDPLLKIASLAKLDVLDLTQEKLVLTLDKARKNDCLVIAEKVESWEAFDLVKKLNFDYFQGFFFSRPEIVPGRKLTSGMLTRIKILQSLANPNCNLDDLHGIIAADPSLSYRMLRLINSASFGLRNKVENLRHAVSLLGFLPLKRWALVIILSDLDSSIKGQELQYIALLRARFMEIMSKECPKPPLHPDAMFLVGLLSCLDAILGMTMDSILEGLSLNDDIQAALTNTKDPAHSWITALRAVEADKWDQAKAFIDGNKFNPVAVSKNYLKASSWAGSLMCSIRAH